MNASTSSAPVQPGATVQPAPSSSERTPIQRAQRFERYSAWPVFLASVVFFAATVTLVSGSVHDPDLHRPLRLAAVVSYVVVLLDFVTRMALARQAARVYFRWHWFEVVGLLLPVLRPFVIIVYLWRLPAFRRSGTTLRARLLITTFLFMFMYVYIVSSAVWLVERGTAGANIVNLDDAIWWGFSTLATVGYGDFVPITATGRVLGVCLMLGGIAIVGTTTALVVSVLGEQLNLRRNSLIAFVGQDSQNNQDEQDEHSPN